MDFVSREPAISVGVLVFIFGTLVQVVSGTDPDTALATALGLSGLQALLTRKRVSPAK